MTENERNDLQLNISHVLQEMKAEAGDCFDLRKVNLAELEDAGEDGDFTIEIYQNLNAGPVYPGKGFAT